MEKTNLQYACLARIVREGGFKVALVARYSAIPGHCKFIFVLRIAPAHRFVSYDCGFLNLWHEALGVCYSGVPILTEAVYHRLHRCHIRAKW